MGLDGGAPVGRLWVVCPCYCDVPAFALLRTRVLEALAAHPATASAGVSFVLIDDTAGTDPAVEGVRNLPDVTVITPPFNLGHQRALVFGLRLILDRTDDDDVIVTMDADGEDQPGDVARLLAPILGRSGHQDLLVIARRTERQESFQFQVMYFFFRIMFRTLTGVTVRSGNFAAYPATLARRMLVHPSFDICYSSTLVSLDLPKEFVPCARGVRLDGESRMNVFRLLMHGIRMLGPFTDRIAVRALLTFAGTFAIGVALAVVAILVRAFTAVAIPGWATAGLVAVLVLSFVALGNFLVLFAVFSHSQGISMSGLEEHATSLGFERADRARPSVAP